MRQIFSTKWDETKWQEARKKKIEREEAQRSELERYIEEAEAAPALSEVGIEGLTGKVTEGNREAEVKILRLCKKAILAVAKTYFSRLDIMTPLEIIRAGELGLKAAIRSFDSTKAKKYNYTFQELTKWWINYGILKELDYQLEEKDIKPREPYRY